MESSNKAVFPLPVGAEMGDGRKACSCDTFYRAGWTYRSLPRAYIVFKGQTGLEYRDLAHHIFIGLHDL